MFKSLVGQAKRAVSDTADRLLGRAVVALFLLIAGAFATTALVIKLIETWGAVVGCLAVAALFALIGLITASVIAAGERLQQEQEAAAAEAEEAPQSTDFASGLASLTAADPGSLITAASTAVTVLRLLGRNTVLVLLAMVAAAYLWSNTSAPTSADASPRPAPAPAE
jgi:small-conductance mechanosensitive channel